MQPVHRRLLPADLAICCRMSDFWPTAQAQGKSEVLYGYLMSLLLNDQMWGSVVELPGEATPITFGGCIFIDNHLARKLKKGEHRYLLIDLASDPYLQTHVLSYEEVIKENPQGLNFYGTIFTFPKRISQFDDGMKTLQASLLDTMTGFNIHRHFKHIYPKHKVDGILSSFAMRLGFGADIIQKYDDEFEPRTAHTPILFGQTREQIMDTDRSKILGERKRTLPVGQLLCRHEPILDLPGALRDVLRLEFEGMKKVSMEHHLTSNSDAEKIWDNCIASLRKKGKLDGIVDPQNKEMHIRSQIKRYVEQHRNELGILRPLTKKEREDWMTTSSEVL